jgi:hypothetical protein
MATLTDYRADLDGLLATAVDASTWTTALKDEAIRQALQQYNAVLVYETSFTVVGSGYEQDLSGISGVNQLLALAWPWSAGADYASRMVRWRVVSGQTVYIENGEPAAQDVIRVRHSKLHTISGLDGAAATNVAEFHRRGLGLLAASWCCTLRVRQLSENPAIPQEAGGYLLELAARFLGEWKERLVSLQRVANPGWSEIGL